MKNDYTLYILMRTDLPSMTTGRAMAQASHAANAFIKKFGKHKEVKAWQRQTKQGFGTAIVLAADRGIINGKFSLMFGYKFKELVVDPDYVIPVSTELLPYIIFEHQKMFVPLDDRKMLFHREEVTCAYIFGSKEDLKPYLGDLPLHP